MDRREETKRRRTHEENTPLRSVGSRTPLGSSTRPNMLRPTASTSHPHAHGTASRPASRSTTPSRTGAGAGASTAGTRRMRRAGTADENAVPARAPDAKDGKGRRALGLGLGLGERPAPAPAGAPGKAGRRAALGEISEQAAQVRPLAGRPLPRPERPPARRQNTAPPEAPAKAAPPRSAPRTPLGSVRRNLFAPAHAPGPAPASASVTTPLAGRLSAAERERLAGLGATTQRTRPPPVTPRAQVGATGRRRRLPPLPEPPTAQPAAGHPYSTHAHASHASHAPRRDKRKISVLEDPDTCSTQASAAAAARFTPSPETHRTAVTARRLLRQAFAPEPEDRFGASGASPGPGMSSFELDVDLPDLDLEDDGFLI